MVTGTIIIIYAFCMYACGIDYDGKLKRNVNILAHIGFACIMVGFWFQI